MAQVTQEVVVGERPEAEEVLGMVVEDNIERHQGTLLWKDRRSDSYLKSTTKTIGTLTHNKTLATGEKTASSKNLVRCQILAVNHEGKAEVVLEAGFYTKRVALESLEVITISKTSMEACAESNARKLTFMVTEEKQGQLMKIESIHIRKDLMRGVTNVGKRGI